MRYLIVGSGAVGGYIGGRLALAGQPVVFLDRPPIVQALAMQGLRLQEDGGDQVLPKPHTATTLNEAICFQTPDIIVLCVKAYHCQEAARELGAVDDLAAPIVCLLNGIGNEETLAKEVGEVRVIPASLTSAVRLIEPGLVRIERMRGLGLASQHPLSARLANEMSAAGLNPVRYDNAQRMKWSKALTNIISNATSAILGWVPDLVFNHKGLYRLEIEALREMVRVMRSMGLAVQNLPGVPVQLLANAIFLPAVTMPLFKKAAISGRGDKLPSFCYDVGRGKSEAPWLNGTTAAEGKRLGIGTPANDVLYQILMGLVEGRLESASYQGNPDLLLGRGPSRRGARHSRV